MESSESKVVIFDKEDVEAHIVMNLFKSLQFEYSYGRKSPSGYNYLRAKDSVKWMGLKPKDYIPLLSSMFNNYCIGLDL